MLQVRTAGKVIVRLAGSRRECLLAEGEDMQRREIDLMAIVMPCA